MLDNLETAPLMGSCLRTSEALSYTVRTPFFLSALPGKAQVRCFQFGEVGACARANLPRSVVASASGIARGDRLEVIKDCFKSRSDAVIRDHAPSHKSVPNEQNDHGTDGCANYSGKFMGTIQASGVTNITCEECPGDAEHGGEDKTLWSVRTGHEQARDGSGNKTD